MKSKELIKHMIMGLLEAINVELESKTRIVILILELLSRVENESLIFVDHHLILLKTNSRKSETST